MVFQSTRNNSPAVSFKEALLNGLAPDGGLYLPEFIPTLPSDFFVGLQGRSLAEIGFVVAREFVGNEILEGELKPLIEDVLSFDIPLVEVSPGISTLELFHGPTMSFKDVGARFMARCIAHLDRNANREVTVLVATSGDTGSAVANGFWGVEGINVVILYPSGKVSHIQEQQLTTMGGNVTALEVNGVFDDCQALVKQAFGDEELREKLRLTSANSINIGRLIPQSFYYFYALAQREDPLDPVAICVPSGNFGNLTAGLMAKRMGLPVTQFVAATNANDIVPQYLATGEYHPRPSTKTLSNAMDVGKPSNFERMLNLYGDSVEAMQGDIKGFHYSDEETMACIAEVKDGFGYQLDPHGAIGYLGLQDLQKSNAIPGVFLETAHPAKFADVIEEHLGVEVPLPPALQELMDKPKEAVQMDPNFEEFKSYLLGRN